LTKGLSELISQQLVAGDDLAKSLNGMSELNRGMSATTEEQINECEADFKRHGSRQRADAGGCVGGGRVVGFDGTARDYGAEPARNSCAAQDRKKNSSGRASTGQTLRNDRANRKTLTKEASSA
jgi:hypothetical protein